MDSFAVFDIAPDNSAVAVATSHGNIWRWDVASNEGTLLRESGEDRPMFNIREVTYTADGVSVMVHHREDASIYFYDAASGDETVVVSDSDNLSSVAAFAASPDGSRFAVAGRGVPGLTVIEAGETWLLPFPALDLTPAPGPVSVAQLHFTPDGMRLVFSGFHASETGENAVFVVDLPGED
jgi:hypothetical protein